MMDYDAEPIGGEASAGENRRCNMCHWPGDPACRHIARGLPPRCNTLACSMCRDRIDFECMCGWADGGEGGEEEEADGASDIDHRHCEVCATHTACEYVPFQCQHVPMRCFAYMCPPCRESEPSMHCRCEDAWDGPGFEEDWGVEMSDHGSAASEYGHPSYFSGAPGRSRMQYSHSQWDAVDLAYWGQFHRAMWPITITTEIVLRDRVGTQLARHIAELAMQRVLYCSHVLGSCGSCGGLVCRLCWHSNPHVRPCTCRRSA